MNLSEHIAVAKKFQGQKPELTLVEATKSQPRNSAAFGINLTKRLAVTRLLENRCEDYPCCGHEPGGCPNKDGSFNCAQCGRKLPKDSQSAICQRCHQKNHKRNFEDPYGDHDHSMDY